MVLPCIRAWLLNKFTFVGQAAQFLLDRGVDPYTIDKVPRSAIWLRSLLACQAIFQFGMPMGPFRLSDLVGGDVYARL